MTDANQNVIEHTEYEPYGAQINSQAQDGPGYTGHVSDTSTGLSYMQQRYYDPLIGRFASVDPVSAESNSGGNFNRYWYASNNPYRFYDPDGRYTCSGSKSGCATVEDAIQKARSAAAGLPEGSTERARLEKITDMYGTAGEKTPSR
ncbi:RHS repeat-associated core domain-containing protein [Lysobacter gummosus]|uniref:RHS repeat-associated core domain-containing protein n=1 Tax=Lysobacter gummosus TaxID=262324 RepID=UPI00363ACBD0